MTELDPDPTVIDAAPDQEESEPEESKPSFKIETLDDLRRILVIAQGGNPDAQQAVSDFLRFDSKVERSHLPTRDDVQLIAWLDLVSESLYPNKPDNPFAQLRDSIATAFMPYKGEKSRQFVEMTKQTPSLSDIQASQDQQRGVLDKIFRRGGNSE